MSDQIPVHQAVAAVTERIRTRSAAGRQAYLAQLAEARTALAGRRSRTTLGCSNLAHAVASCGASDKATLTAGDAASVGIVTSYNDMLSAHQPYETYPQQIKAAVAAVGGVARVAGGVPAMCDGITQGRPGMELSLFSREVIAMSTAIALSHDVFDSALMLGVCDKIVPGLVAGSLAFGHLPTVFVPAGPMHSGLPNADKAEVRRAHAAGEVGKDALLAAEVASYHSPGTCTFYGTANSNQLLMDVMGLHLPGAAFVPPDGGLRAALTDAAARRAVELATGPGGEGPAYGIGDVVDERCVVNGAVALLATGGSTNHTMHLVAMARAAGITLTWEDLADLSAVVPLVARMYPNGTADVNHFHAAGGTPYLVKTLLDNGFLHEDVLTVDGPGLRRHTRMPSVDDAGTLTWTEVTESTDHSVLRPADDPFSPDGGLRVLSGGLGHAVIKVSAVAPDRRVVEGPVRVYDGQQALLESFSRRELDPEAVGDSVVVVVRGQGPAANGMPELHSLTPTLSVMQRRGQAVAIVTDGRMSGASGAVPAAIHVTPEAALGGPIARLRDGDVVRLDSTTGRLDVLVDDDEWAQREPVPVDTDASARGTGRELFAALRATVGRADTGAGVFPSYEPVPHTQPTPEGAPA